MVSIIHVRIIAKDSLITEIIKKTELKKYFDFNKNLDLIERVEKNLLQILRRTYMEQK